MQKKEIDIEQVEALAGRGLTEQEICLAVGVSRSTLLRRKKQHTEFREAIERGKARSHVVVANALFQLCKQGNLGAIIWYEKSRCGMSEDGLLLSRIAELEEIVSSLEKNSNTQTD